MSTTTTISWTDKTWNPTVGCSRVDHRCDNCYAMHVAARGMSESHRGLTKIRPRGSKRPGVDWNGKVRRLPDRLEEPMRWRAPTRVFVDSMSDLFHPSVPDAFLDRVWEVMEVCARHTFLVLTKRPQRAAVYTATRLTLPNVHLGVSVSDMETWVADVPQILRADAAVKWVSLEPLLGDVPRPLMLRELDWVVVGGESGRNRRPCDVSWVRTAVARCRDAEVPVFVKQLGGRAMMRADTLEGRRSGDHPEREWPEGTRFTTAPGHMGTIWQGRWARLHDNKGETMEEWPVDLRIRQYPRDVEVEET